MSHAAHLWKLYLEDDVDGFRSYLADPGGQASKSVPRVSSSSYTDQGNFESFDKSPSASYSTSPQLLAKARRPSGRGHGAAAASKSSNVTLNKADLNSRDHMGLTILHHVASSDSINALSFASLLLSQPHIDLYIQDFENGWTALHRALYFGNISIARALIRYDSIRATTSYKGSGTRLPGNVYKIKDHEGNGPFDLLSATTASRSIHLNTEMNASSEMENSSDDDNDELDANDIGSQTGSSNAFGVGGDAVYVWGSNKNISLGLNNEDDREFPEAIVLQRTPESLRRLHREKFAEMKRSVQQEIGVDKSENSILTSNSASTIPTLIQMKPIHIRNVFLSKLHTAIITMDERSNLYTTGFGPGGRLGTGDEATRYTFECIEGGGLANQCIIDVGLGHHHTLVVSDEGNVYSWGNNSHGQLGYTLPERSKDEDVTQLSPRQIFGPLKKEFVLGVAASRLHSVVFTETELYSFGRNIGQLGLRERSEIETLPRKVTASPFPCPIKSVCAIERATIVCLVDSRDIWVFANFGFTKVSFPLEGPANDFVGKGSVMTTRYAKGPNCISKVAAAGDTIAAMSHTGDVYTLSVSRTLERSPAVSSTTNPSKIRGALSPPQRVYSSKKLHMAIADVDVSGEGSVIILTKAGSVWIREKRANLNEATALQETDHRPRGFKFRRVPGLNRVVGVRSNAYGAFAAIRKDVSVTRDQIHVSRQTLWDDVSSLSPLADIDLGDSDASSSQKHEASQGKRKLNVPGLMRLVLQSLNLPQSVTSCLGQAASITSFDMEIRSSDCAIVIPCHQFILSARSPVIQRLLAGSHTTGQTPISDSVWLQRSPKSRLALVVQNVDAITLINLAVFLYQDQVLSVWQHIRGHPKQVDRFKKSRTELLKLATQLKIDVLEEAVRRQVLLKETLHFDMDRAIRKRQFFESGDLVVQLMNTEIQVHSAVMLRCPFFKGLFDGRAAGLWLSERKEAVKDSDELLKIDLKHIDPAIFKLVLRFIYADVGEEIFEDLNTKDLDDFLDVVLSVAFAADELMLDRLSQISQKILGNLVDISNVCYLVNAAAPCSVTLFKTACLEYIVLNLEAMLENHLLDELQDDLMSELDQAVRLNHRALLPYVTGKYTEDRLVRFDPFLPSLIKEEQENRIKAARFRVRLLETNPRPGSAYRNRPVSAGKASGYQTQRKLRGADTSDLQATGVNSVDGGPDDHIFPLDLGDDQSPWVKSKTKGNKSPLVVPAVSPIMGATKSTGKEITGSFDKLSYDSKGRLLSKHADKQLDDDAFPSIGASNLSHRPSSVQPWSPQSSSLDIKKADLQSIMTQAKKSRSSNLARSIGQQETQTEEFGGSIQAKMSQRERKRNQQARLLESTQSHPSVLKKEPEERKSSAGSPWKTGSWSSPTALTPVSNASIPSVPNISTLSSSPSPLTKHAPKRPMRIDSSPTIAPRNGNNSTTPPFPATTADILFPTGLSSIIDEQAEEALQLRRAMEQKRPLLEIQQEQEFQEWWDGEARRVQLEQQEADTTANITRPVRGSRGRGRTVGGRDRGGRGGRVQRAAGIADNGSRDGSPSSTAAVGATAEKTPSPARGGRGRGQHPRRAKATSRPST